MPEWITHTHAGFVLAAYAVAAVALLGLALASWHACRCRTEQWRKLNRKLNNDS